MCARGVSTQATDLESDFSQHGFKVDLTCLHCARDLVRKDINDGILRSIMIKKNISFRRVVTPDNKCFHIPTDIELVFPKESLPPDLLRCLVCIPWERDYLDFVPERFRSFFEFVLPYLRPRTTDVHTAVCLSYWSNYTEKLEKEMGVKINKKIVAYGLILHDCGWSALTKKEIVNSFAVKGLKIKGEAIGPKRRHAEEGVKIARKILNEYKFEPALTEEEKEVICEAVFWHDKTDKVRGNKFPIEIKAVVDLDHLWSFTKLNFWQDTLRKNVSPQDYLKNLENDLDSYFIFEIGKELAHTLLKERKEEVGALLGMK